MEAVKLRHSLHLVMQLSARGNAYLQSSGLNKTLMQENPKRCAQVMARATNLIYLLSVLIHPFMPSTEQSILAQLNAPSRSVPEVFSNDILAGHQIGKPEHLFKKIDEKMAEVWRAKFGGSENTPAADAAANAEAAPALSKRKAQAAKKAAAKAATAEQDSGPKSPEVLAWEQKVAEQGQVVRELKTQPKSEENDKAVSAAVDVLKRLKAELTAHQKQQQAA